MLVITYREVSLQSLRTIFLAKMTKDLSKGTEGLKMHCSDKTQQCTIVFYTSFKKTVQYYFMLK
jgi:hypothetical protein